MKRLWGLVALTVLCGVLAHGAARAADPDKIKVGILLPLTGTFAAVAETQKQGALLADAQYWHFMPAVAKILAEESLLPPALEQIYLGKATPKDGLTQVNEEIRRARI